MFDAALAIHHGDVPPVIGCERMIDECHFTAVGADTHIADPAIGLEKYLADGKFKALLAAIAPHDSKVFAVARDVGVVDILQDRTRRATIDRHTRERAAL